MLGSNNHSPGLTTLVRQLVRTGVGAVRNRLELFVVEWQEERSRMMQALAWSVGLILATVLAVLLFTATIILLFREDLRIYVAAAFTVIYVIAAFLALVGLRNVLKRTPFEDSIGQVQKDRAWLESMK
jgi:uncharacterized membrane protein YqjE